MHVPYLYLFFWKVDFDNPDLNSFPRFNEIRGMEVALEPGEVLYIPSFWWHYIESEMHRSELNTLTPRAKYTKVP